MWRMKIARLRFTWKFHAVRFERGDFNLWRYLLIHEVIIFDAMVVSVFFLVLLRLPLTELRLLSEIVHEILYEMGYLMLVTKCLWKQLWSVKLSIQFLERVQENSTKTCTRHIKSFMLEMSTSYHPHSY